MGNLVSPAAPAVGDIICVTAWYPGDADLGPVDLYNPPEFLNVPVKVLKIDKGDGTSESPHSARVKFPSVSHTTDVLLDYDTWRYVSWAT